MHFCIFKELADYRGFASSKYQITGLTSVWPYLADNCKVCEDFTYPQASAWQTYANRESASSLESCT